MKTPIKRQILTTTDAGPTLKRDLFYISCFPGAAASRTEWMDVGRHVFKPYLYILISQFHNIFIVSCELLQR